MAKARELRQQGFKEHSRRYALMDACHQTPIPATGTIVLITVEYSGLIGWLGPFTVPRCFFSAGIDEPRKFELAEAR